MKNNSNWKHQEVYNESPTEFVKNILLDFSSYSEYLVSYLHSSEF